MIGLLISIQACENHEQPRSDTSSIHNTSPLDAILGDKILNDSTDEVRPNNFEALLLLDKASLSLPSNLYEVIQVSNDLKLLKQRKSYKEARTFSALLRLKKEKVDGYKILQDLVVRDVMCTSNKLYVLADDIENHNTYWKTQNKVVLYVLDSRLNVLIEREIINQNPLQASSFALKNDTLTVEIDVIQSCAICTNTVELQFDEKLNCHSAKEMKRTNTSDSLSAEFLQGFIDY